MVEIRFKGNYEVADLAGKSLADVRQDYEGRFDIPAKATVKLNDRKVRQSQEESIKLRDSDEVRFGVERAGKGTLLAGALMLALALTGATFAFGYLTNSVTLTTVSAAGGDFASVAAAGGTPTFTVYGNTKGTIPAGNLFSVNTTAGYPGDLTVTVAIANGDQLSKVYRVLNLFITAENSTGGPMDINGDGVYNSGNDFALLTLSNGSVDLYINQTYGSDNYTVRVDRGFYVSNIWGSGWSSGYHQPVLYAQVAQR